MVLNGFVRLAAISGVGMIMMSHAKAADLSIVIDDSAGMCGYLNAPLERSAYKKGLQTLLQAKDAGNLDVNAYFLSDLTRPLPLGPTLDKIIQSTAKTCPFMATTSPLQQGIDLKKVKSSSVILVTDLLFDQGSQGSSQSRSEFINHFDQLAFSKQKSSKDWFTASAGIIGIKSLFSGAYYNIHDRDKVDLKDQSVERPFYWVYLSTTPKFFPYLEQMTQVWSVPNWGSKKLAVEGIYAVRLLPLTALLSVNGLSMAPVSSSFIVVPTIYYGKDSSLVDDVLPINGTGDYPNPLECFMTTVNPLLVKFDVKCAKGGANENALYRAEKFPQSIILAFPVNNRVEGLSRQYQVQTMDGGFSNTAQAYYRDSNQSRVYQENNKKNNTEKLNIPNLIVKIQELHSSKSLLLNGTYVKDKNLRLSLVESYVVPPNAMEAIVPTANLYWSDDNEPCVDKTTACQKASQSTYMLKDLISSLTTRLKANQRAVELLNQQPQLPTIITIEANGAQ